MFVLLCVIVGCCTTRLTFYLNSNSIMHPPKKNHDPRPSLHNGLRHRISQGPPTLPGPPPRLPLLQQGRAKCWCSAFRRRRCCTGFLLGMDAPSKQRSEPVSLPTLWASLNSFCALALVLIVLQVGVNQKRLPSNREKLLSNRKRLPVQSEKATE